MNAEKKRNDLTIYITTDSEIRLLNRKFHGTNAPTDVLSFPSHPVNLSLRGLRSRAQRGGSRTKQPRVHIGKRGSIKGLAVTEGSNYLGDIVISYDRARLQAHPRKKRGGSDDAGWRVADELDLLVVHGLLHLVGYDDAKPRAQKRMWERQEEILKKKEIP